MTDPHPTPLSLQRLAVHLRRLRKKTTFTQIHAAEAAGIARETLSKIEKARQRPYERTLEALLDLYDAPEPKRAEMQKLWVAAAPASRRARPTTKRGQ